MTVRSAIVAAALALLGVGVFALPTEAARRPARCHPRRHEVVGRKRAAVIFYRSEGPEGEYPAPSTVFGCLTSRQRPVRLVHFPEGLSPEFEHLAGGSPVFAGRYAAFALTEYDVPCGKYTGGGPECEGHLVGSYDLRTGRARASSASAALALALTRQGWIAWVAPHGDSLHAVDSHGERLLDPGPVEPVSLQASGRVVRWNSGGTSHSAELT